MTFIHVMPNNPGGNLAIDVDEDFGHTEGKGRRVIRTLTESAIFLFFLLPQFSRVWWERA